MGRVCLKGENGPTTSALHKILTMTERPADNRKSKMSRLLISERILHIIPPYTLQLYKITSAGMSAGTQGAYLMFSDFGRPGTLL